MKQSEALKIVATKIANCKKCSDLAEQMELIHGNHVPGAGCPNAKIMIIGEAPGANEEKEGIPFVGKAGKLLTSILKACGWSKEEVFITNILKCRPPGNRDPLPDEAANCRKFLDLQIKIVNPEWILCFGRIASIYLLSRNPETRMGSMRGEIFDYKGKKVICTYHPSFLLRKPAAKQDVWEDLQQIIKK